MMDKIICLPNGVCYSWLSFITKKIFKELKSYLNQKHGIEILLKYSTTIKSEKSLQHPWPWQLADQWKLPTMGFKI